MPAKTKTTAKPKSVKKSTAPESLIVDAKAGTGKTTTLEWNEMGVPKGMKPSEQQQAIFDALKMTPAEKRKATTRFSCFNVTIKNELQDRLPNSECVTNNALGHRLVGKRIKGYLKVDARKYEYLAKDLIGDPWKNKELFPIIKTATNLADMARVTLTGHEDGGTWHVTPNQLVEMSVQYSMPIESVDGIQYVEPLIQLGINAALKGKLDFNDQVFLPAVWGLSPDKVTRGYIDEAQDLNNAQRQLLLKSAEQLVIVGDPNQSIYLFAGAAPDSMSVMQQALNCPVLPLSITRRCPKSHVEYARKFLPRDAMFSAHEGNIDGSIIRRKIDMEVFSNIVNNNIDNLFISRTNAPLVKNCFACYRNNIPATIRGRDFAAQAKGKLRKLKAKTNVEAIEELTIAIDKKIEILTAQGKGDLVEAAHDELAVFMIFLSETSSIDEACARIDSMFSDDALAKGVKFTTAHKAKGLEAHTGGILTPELFPHPGIAKINPAQAQQEMNCAYVAHTRFKNTMIINEGKDG